MIKFLKQNNEFCVLTSEYLKNSFSNKNYFLELTKIFEEKVKFYKIDSEGNMYFHPLTFKNMYYIKQQNINNLSDDFLLQIFKNENIINQIRKLKVEKWDLDESFCVLYNKCLNANSHKVMELNSKNLNNFNDIYLNDIFILIKNSESIYKCSTLKYVVRKFEKDNGLVKKRVLR